VVTSKYGDEKTVFGLVHWKNKIGTGFVADRRTWWYLESGEEEMFSEAVGSEEGFVKDSCRAVADYLNGGKDHGVFLKIRRSKGDRG